VHILDLDASLHDAQLQFFVKAGKHIHVGHEFFKSENSKAIPEPIRLDEKPKALCPFLKI
jgi:hypothetical protein